jgi:hypothetical protein
VRALWDAKSLAESTLVINNHTPAERMYGTVAIAATGALTRSPKSLMVTSGQISSGILSWRAKIGFATAPSNILYTSDGEYPCVYY